MLTLWAYNMVGKLYVGGTTISVPYLRWRVAAYKQLADKTLEWAAPWSAWTPITNSVILDTGGVSEGYLDIEVESDYTYQDPYYYDRISTVENGWAYPAFPDGEPPMPFASAEYGLDGASLLEYQVSWPKNTEPMRLTYGKPATPGPGGNPSGGSMLGQPMLLLIAAAVIGMVILTRRK